MLLWRQHQTSLLLFIYFLFCRSSVRLRLFTGWTRARVDSLTFLAWQTLFQSSLWYWTGCEKPAYWAEVWLMKWWVRPHSVSDYHCREEWQTGVGWNWLSLPAHDSRVITVAITLLNMEPYFKRHDRCIWCRPSNDNTAPFHFNKTHLWITFLGFFFCNNPTPQLFLLTSKSSQDQSRASL